jgi:uncharacterized protein YdhG (YjbR/CyaY superfamily)
MGKKKEPGVEGVLARLDPERRGLVDALRSIVKQTVPEVKETVKWGNIT